MARAWNKIHHKFRRNKSKRELFDEQSNSRSRSDAIPELSNTESSVATKTESSFESITNDSESCLEWVHVDTDTSPSSLPPDINASHKPLKTNQKSHQNIESLLDSLVLQTTQLSSAQSTFDALILDTQTKEGRIIAHWLRILQNKKQKERTQLSQIGDFIHKLAHTFADSHDININDALFTPILNMCFQTILNQRVVNRMVQQQLSQCEHEAMDSTYLGKAKWMRALNETQLGICAHHWLKSATRVPFAKGIQLIGQLQTHPTQKRKRKRFKMKKDKSHMTLLAPSVALQTLSQAIECMYATAVEYYYDRFPDKRGDVEDEGELISQDELFPIVVYCVMHSKLETPYRLIGWIESMLPPQMTTMGQPAFALSAFKAAVEYISCARPDMFGLDAEIEEM